MRETVYNGKTPEYSEIPDAEEVTDGIAFMADDYILCTCDSMQCKSLHVMMRRYEEMDNGDEMPRVAATFSVKQIEEMLMVARVIERHKRQ